MKENIESSRGCRATFSGIAARQHNIRKIFQLRIGTSHEDGDEQAGTTFYLEDLWLWKAGNEKRKRAS